MNTTASANSATKQQLTVSKPEKFSKEVGQLLNQFTDKTEVTFNGMTFSIPSAKSADGFERFAAVVKGVTDAIFTGIDKEVKPKNKEHIAILKGIAASGFHFADFTRVSVLEGVKTRIAAKKSVITLKRNVTREMKENKTYIAVTNTARELNKLVKEEGLSAAIKRLEEMKKDKTDAGIKLIDNS